VTSSAAARPPWRLVGLTVLALVAANVLVHRATSTRAQTTLVLAALVLVLVAVSRTAGLGATDLGLDRAALRRALPWLAGALAVVLFVLAVAQAQTSAVTWPVAVRVLVVIPLATVLPEEIAFRGVLLALLAPALGRRSAAVVSSALFALWHVLPALGDSAANEVVADTVGTGVAGVVLRVILTLAFTAAAGLLLCWVRWRSDSLVAPAALHWAVNSGGLLVVAAAG
jgi:membrane protease YdiL (CAAX protease family)